MTTSLPAELGRAAASHPVRRTRFAFVRRAAVAVSVAVMVAVYIVVAAPTMVAAVRSLAGASMPWVLSGLAATVGSMLAFAALRAHTLAIGGAHVPIRRTLALSYGAGAVHTTLPAGAVFSTTYAFRHLRAWGASTSVATWSLTITGLLSTVTLSAVGLLGLALSGGTGGSPILPTVEIVMALSVIYAVLRISRHPAGVVRLAHRILLRINSFRGLPAKTGMRRFSEIAADLQVIRPARRDWFAAAGLALLNWLLDLGCLAACCAAVGLHIGFPALLITYVAGMAAGSLLPLPGGLGAVETAMTLGLTVAGAVAAPALAAVLMYRLLSTGSVLLIGWVVVATQRLHHVPIARAASTDLG